MFLRNKTKILAFFPHKKDKVKIIVGGASVNQDFADSIGADGYGKDAIEAVKVAKKLLQMEVGEN